jgi:hypothetical protein
VPAKRVKQETTTTEPDVDTFVEWGVELPDGEVCACQNEYDADALVNTAKVFNPRAKYKKVSQEVTVTRHPWMYA